jgi:hypothetical protein
MSRTILSGTRIYLTRTHPTAPYTDIDDVLALRVDRNFLGDILYVLYDVKVGTLVVIPKGTAVMGDWITESSPCIAAQLQITDIFLDGLRFPVVADSEIYHQKTSYGYYDVHNANHVEGLLTYRSTANICRRIVNVRCRTKILADDEWIDQLLYLRIDTNEIPVTLLDNFTA